MWYLGANPRAIRASETTFRGVPMLQRASENGLFSVSSENSGDASLGTDKESREVARGVALDELERHPAICQKSTTLTAATGQVLQSLSAAFVGSQAQGE